MTMVEADNAEQKLLFKYVAADRALRCLPEIGDGVLRATQPAVLNDPFECSTKRVFVESYRNTGNQQLAQTLTEIQPLSPVGEQDIEEARKSYGSLYMGELFRQQLSMRFGIISFSTNLFHPLLWSHYAQDGSGFAIGYKFETMKNLIKGGIYLRPIKYVPKPGVICDYKVLSTPESNILQIMQCKSDLWKYESEWRLIVELDLTIGTGERDRFNQPVNLFRIPNDAVGAVYYTERTEREVVLEVQRRLQLPNNRYGTRNVNKLVLSEDAYRYQDSK